MNRPAVGPWGWVDNTVGQGVFLAGGGRKEKINKHKE